MWCVHFSLIRHVFYGLFYLMDTWDTVYNKVQQKPSRYRLARTHQIRAAALFTLIQQSAELLQRIHLGTAKWSQRWCCRCGERDVVFGQPCPDTPLNKFTSPSVMTGVRQSRRVMEPDHCELSWCQCPVFKKNRMFRLWRIRSTYYVCSLPLPPHHIFWGKGCILKLNLEISNSIHLSSEKFALETQM